MIGEQPLGKICAVEQRIAGYVIANDVSARDFATPGASPFGIDWLRHKSFDSLLPMGPAVVPSRYVPDPMKLDIRLSVNGQSRQSSNTEQMIFSIDEQVAALSSVVSLRAGDLLLTGTPAGTAAAYESYLETGDVMVAEIEGLGSLTNVVA